MDTTEFGFLDRNQPVGSVRGNLPHWRQEAVTYFVTFRLGDSLPEDTCRQWQRERLDWSRRNPPPHSPSQKKEYRDQFIQPLQKWLDAGAGSCVLSDPGVRQIVSQAITHFQGTRYFLREWVVMPNHVHAVVTPREEHSLSAILHSWKSFTANAINQHLGRVGSLWQKETFDHIVRSPEQLERIEQYIHDNPRHLPPETFTLGCVH